MMALFTNGIIVFFVCYLRIYGHSLEPQCSKFAYEEKMLEKMVRLEFNVMKMAEGIKQAEENVKDGLTKLQTETNRLENKINSEFSNLQAEIQKSKDQINAYGVKLQTMESNTANKLQNLTDDNEDKINTLQTNVEESQKHTESIIARMSADLTEWRNTTMQEIIDQINAYGVKLQTMESNTANKLQNLTDDNEDKINTLQTNVEESQKHTESIIARMSADQTEWRNTTMQEIIDKTRTPAILFRARGLKDRNPGKNQKLVFEIVLENEGDGYNKDTGVFTAPQDGEYTFSVQLCSYNSKGFVFAFMENGVAKQPAELENGYVSCGTSLYMTKIKAHTEIWIQSFLDYSEPHLFVDSSYRYNILSGILIK